MGLNGDMMHSLIINFNTRYCMMLGHYPVLLKHSAFKNN